jgi:hypothetical protein
MLNREISSTVNSGLDESEYPLTFYKKVNLDKSLQPEIAKKLIGSPHFYQLIYNGLLKFYKIDGKEYLEDEWLKLNDEFDSHQPKLEEQEKNRYRVVELDLTSESKVVTTEIIRATIKAPFSKQRMTVRYTPNRVGAVFELTFSYKSQNTIAIEIVKAVFDLVVERLNRVADNPSKAIKDFTFVSSLEFELSNEFEMKDMRHRLSAPITVHSPISKLQQAINKPNLLREILPNIEEINTQNKDLIKKGDSCVMSMTNINYQGNVFKEKVTFYIESFDDNNIFFISNKNVTHFHQFAFLLSLEKTNSNDITTLRMNLYYSNSYIVAAMGTVTRWLGLFSEKSTDSTLFIHLRALNLLSAAVRRLPHNLGEQLGVEIIECEKFKPIESSIRMTNSIASKQE